MFNKNAFPWFGWIRSLAVAHPWPCHGQSYEWRWRKLAPACAGLDFSFRINGHLAGELGGALAHAMKLTASALVLSEISSLALRHLAPPAAGLYKTRKKKQRSSELDAVFSFSFCGEDEIRTRGTGCPVRRFSKPVYGKNFCKNIFTLYSVQ